MVREWILSTLKIPSKALIPKSRQSDYTTSSNVSNPGPIPFFHSCSLTRRSFSSTSQFINETVALKISNYGHFLLIHQIVTQVHQKSSCCHNPSPALLHHLRRLFSTLTRWLTWKCRQYLREKIANYPPAHDDTGLGRSH